MRIAHCILPIALIVLVTLPACAQSSEQSSEQTSDQARADRIIENLKFEFEQLRPLNVEMQSIEDSGIEGVEIGTFIIQGTQAQQFLLTSDDQLYLVAGGPIDVGRTDEDLDALRATAQESEVEAANYRMERLDEVIADKPMRGSPDAPVTIVEFSDFECPYCRRVNPTIDELLESRSDVNLVYLHFPLGNHPWARPAAIASICAANQDHDAFWTLHDAYFADQSSFSTSNVMDRSRNVLADTGIDMSLWETCAADESSDAHSAAVAELTASMQIAREFGVTGTPAFFVNGIAMSGAKPLAEFEETIERALDTAN